MQADSACRKEVAFDDPKCSRSLCNYICMLCRQLMHRLAIRVVVDAVLALCCVCVCVCVFVLGVLTLLWTYSGRGGHDLLRLSTFERQAQHDSMLWQASLRNNHGNCVRMSWVAMCDRSLLK